MATIEQICEVLKAYEEGKIVQTKRDGGNWYDLGVAEFEYWSVQDLLNFELRVKPEPREVWGVVGKKGNVLLLKSKQEADIYKDCYDYDRVTKFREVFDESE